MHRKEVPGLIDFAKSSGEYSRRPRHASILHRRDSIKSDWYHHHPHQIGYSEVGVKRCAVSTHRWICVVAVLGDEVDSVLGLDMEDAHPAGDA